MRKKTSVNGGVRLQKTSDWNGRCSIAIFDYGRVYPNVSIIIIHKAVCQNLVPLVNLKIAGKWMFIPLKMVLIGIDPYP